MAIDPNTGIDDAAPGGIAPPDNQAVLDYIAGQRAAFQPNYAGETYTPFGFAAGAAQPGMSGYFDLDYSGGSPSILPHIFGPQQVAEQAGVSPGQFAGGIFPGGPSYGGVGYNVPNNQGGFFSLDSFFGNRGIPIGEGAAQNGGGGYSTNNYRLFGGQPGQIMRNGQIIHTLSPATRYGKYAGDAVGTGSAESGMTLTPQVAPYNAMVARNVWDAYYWPGASSFTGFSRWPAGTNV